MLFVWFIVGFLVGVWLTGCVLVGISAKIGTTVLYNDQISNIDLVKAVLIWPVTIIRGVKIWPMISSEIEKEAETITTE